LKTLGFSRKRGFPQDPLPIVQSIRHPRKHSDRYWIEPEKDSGGLSDFSQGRTDSFSTMKRTKRRKFWAAICLAIPFVSTNYLDNPIANAQQGCSELPGSACDKACDSPLGSGSTSGGSSCDAFGAASSTASLASFGTIPGQWQPE
jgi:hypothetical protein